MRSLLFIPVLVLFLSNVPFIQRIPMQRAMAMMNETETCGEQSTCKRNTENFSSTCSPEKSTCDESCASDEEGVKSSNDSCSETEATCVCICCFQYAAPVNTITEYQFNCSLPSIIAYIFIVGHIRDPHIGAPWQPPDLV